MDSGIEFLELLSVALLSGVKFIVGVGLAITYGLPFLVSALSTFLGGIVGVMVYMFFGEYLLRVFRRLFPPKRRFTRARRRVVRLKQRGGLWLIAFLTPLLLSIPLGTFASVSLGFPWYRILLAMSLSLAFWSLLLFSIYWLIGFDVHEYLKHLIPSRV
jgi:hypothetical protein